MKGSAILFLALVRALPPSLVGLRAGFLLAQFRPINLISSLKKATLSSVPSWVWCALIVASVNKFCMDIMDCVNEDFYQPPAAWSNDGPRPCCC